jgi:hypothetical protein
MAASGKECWFFARPVGIRAVVTRAGRGAGADHDGRVIVSGWNSMTFADQAGGDLA